MQCAVGVWGHSPRPLVRCHGCWFTHSQFHSRRLSLRITLKSTTLVCMRSRSAWTGIDDNGAEVTNGLQQRIVPFDLWPLLTASLLASSIMSALARSRSLWWSLNACFRDLSSASLASTAFSLSSLASCTNTHWIQILNLDKSVLHSMALKIICFGVAHIFLRLDNSWQACTELFQKGDTRKRSLTSKRRCSSADKQKKKRKGFYFQKGGAIAPVAPPPLSHGLAQDIQWTIVNWLTKKPLVQ